MKAYRLRPKGPRRPPLPAAPCAVACWPRVAGPVLCCTSQAGASKGVSLLSWRWRGGGCCCRPHGTCGPIVRSLVQPHWGCPLHTRPSARPSQGGLVPAVSKRPSLQLRRHAAPGPGRGSGRCGHTDDRRTLGLPATRRVDRVDHVRVPPAGLGLVGECHAELAPLKQPVDLILHPRPQPWHASTAEAAGRSHRRQPVRRADVIRASSLARVVRRHMKMTPVREWHGTTTTEGWRGVPGTSCDARRR